jgi:hypothetical protein
MDGDGSAQHWVSKCKNVDVDADVERSVVLLLLFRVVFSFFSFVLSGLTPCVVCCFSLLPFCEYKLTCIFCFYAGLR